jgi:hypothetical protein
MTVAALLSFSRSCAIPKNKNATRASLTKMLSLNHSVLKDPIGVLVISPPVAKLFAPGGRRVFLRRGRFLLLQWK